MLVYSMSLLLSVLVTVVGNDTVMAEFRGMYRQFYSAHESHDNSDPITTFGNMTGNMSMQIDITPHPLEQKSNITEGNNPEQFYDHLRKFRPIYIYAYVDQYFSFFFFIELLLRFGTCPNKCDFFKDIYNIIDVLGVTAQILSAILFYMWIKQIFYFESFDGLNSLACLATLVRVVKLMNLARFHISSRVFMLTILESRREILLLLFLYLSCSTFFALFVYYCESEIDRNINSAAAGIWWSFITMTTVGYGDMYPKSDIGKLSGVLCAFCGVICTTLPVAVVANNYNVIYRTAKIKMSLKIQ